MNEVVIIPTLDPNGSLVTLVGALQDRGFKWFIVVDDGSDQRCWWVFRRLEEYGCLVIHHDANKGKGAAIKTALSVMGMHYPDARGFITADGDGQHLAADVLHVAQDFEEHPDSIVLGERQLHSKMVPLRSRFGNGFSSLFFKLDTGHACADTQTGLRCIPASLALYARGIEGDRYDFEMNFLTRAVKDGKDVRMVPITTVYERNNSNSHFRTVADAYLIYRSFIRFSLSSLSCAAVDLGLFTLISLLLNANIYALVFAATAIARMSSGGLNFYLNHRWSFRSGDKPGGSVSAQLVRYTVLFFAQMCVSALLVALLAFLPIPLVVTKIIVDSCLFVVSYFVQRNWVFADSGEKSADRGVTVYGKGQ